MPAPLTAGLPLPGAPATHQPSVIAIPGSSPNRTNRRSATNPRARLSAYVVRDIRLPDAPLATINVAIKANTRLLGLSLKGHIAPIVDLEFLQTPADTPVHVLGTCDEDGIVILWFLQVEIDALRIPVALRLLRKYSFYSLRKSRAAFYSRIRLAGNVETGTMVLVPNDGSDVRVVTFHCEPTDDSSKPNMPVIAPPPGKPALQIEPPQKPSTESPRDVVVEEKAATPIVDPTLDVPPAPVPPQFDSADRVDDEFVDAVGDATPRAAVGAAAVGATAVGAVGIAAVAGLGDSQEDVAQRAATSDLDTAKQQVAAGVDSAEHQLANGRGQYQNDDFVQTEGIAGQQMAAQAQDEYVHEQAADEFVEQEDEEEEEEESEEEEEELDEEEEEFEAEAIGNVIGH